MVFCCITPPAVNEFPFTAYHKVFCLLLYRVISDYWQLLFFIFITFFSLMLASRTKAAGSDLPFSFIRRFSTNMLFSTVCVLGERRSGHPDRTEDDRGDRKGGPEYYNRTVLERHGDGQTRKTSPWTGRVKMKWKIEEKNKRTDKIDHFQRLRHTNPASGPILKLQSFKVMLAQAGCASKINSVITSCPTHLRHNSWS